MMVITEQSFSIPFNTLISFIVKDASSFYTQMPRYITYLLAGGNSGNFKLIGLDIVWATPGILTIYGTHLFTVIMLIVIISL